jgi:hypothetical protein
MAYALGNSGTYLKEQTRAQELEKKIPVWSNVAQT